MKGLLTLVFSIFTLGLSGCDTGPKSGWGFTLPDGDADRGKAVFMEMYCTDCHKVVGNSDIPHPDDAEITVNIGGKTRVVKTYGQLVTSVINPSHRLAKGYDPAMIQEQGQSKMPNYNSVMTVQQLVDLVTFLQSQYELQPYTRSHYPIYP